VPNRGENQLNTHLMTICNQCETVKVKRLNKKTLEIKVKQIYIYELNLHLLAIKKILYASAHTTFEIDFWVCKWITGN